MAESNEEIAIPQSEERLRKRIRELEAEVKRLRAAHQESADAAASAPQIRNDAGPATPLGRRYKQVSEILDLSADAIVSTDSSGKILRFNRGAEIVFGHQSSEIIGRPLDILIPERFRRSHRSHLATFTRSDVTSRLMNERTGVYGLRKDGSEFPAEASIVRLDNSGRPVNTIILRDTSERKAAEAALRESEAQLRQAQKLARIGTFIWDEGADNCAFCSDELGLILGRDAEAFSGKSFSRSWMRANIHPDDRATYDAVIAGYREAGMPYDVEFRFIRGDGRSAHLREVGEPEKAEAGGVFRTFGTIQDITDIRRAEETIRRSESLLSQAQRLARLGTFIWDDETDQCIYCSQELAALFAMTPAQFIANRGANNKYLAFLHPDDRGKMMEAITAGIEDGMSYDIEYRAYDANGELWHFREIAEAIKDAEGKTIRTFGTLQDVTSLREAQEALRVSESQLRQAQRMARVGTYVWDDKNGICVECSEELADLFGMSAAEFIETRGTHGKMRAHIHPEDLENNVRSGEWAAGERLAYDVEFRAWDKFGELRHFRETAQPSAAPNSPQQLTFCTLLDISDIRQTERALRQSEEQFRSLIEGSIQGVLIHRDFKPAFVNQTFAEIFGYDSPAEIFALDSCLPLIAADERDRLNGFKEARAKNLYPPERYEFRGMRKDGSEIFLENRARLVSWDGEPAILAVMVDITERLAAEEALRQTIRSAELLRQIATAANEATSAEQAISACLEAMGRFGEWHLASAFMLAEDGSGDMVPAGIWWTEGQDDISTFRHITEDIRFASGSGLPGRVARSKKPAWIKEVRKDRNFPRARLADELDVTSGFAFPILVGHKVAAVLEFYSRDRRKQDDNLVDVAARAGTILGRVVERQRAARALRDSEEQIRLITDNIPVLIAYVDLEGKFRFVNKTTESWYAAPADELVGRTVRTFFGEAEFAKMSGRIDRALAGEPVYCQETLTYRDGNTRHIDATYVPHLASNGTVRGIFTVVLDVTERRQAEEALRHSQRMEAVGKLTGGVAHDFNNLLAVILGNAELTRDQLGPNDPAIQAIVGAAQRGAALTQRLLAFSRQQPLRPRAVDLTTHIREIADILSRTLGETIQIEIDSAADSWPASVDSGELENAILNLAINARDAMPDGGKLKIATGNVTIDGATAGRFQDARPGDYVRISIIDTGFGMADDILSHAFEPFYTTKPFGEGRGLGLSMVYGFATQSGGFTSIESNVGKGTTVNLYLPRASSEQRREIEVPAPCVPKGNGATIMVVEDDLDVRKLTVTLLKSMGYNVLSASDADSALPLLLGDAQIDLLLSDVVLPGDLTGPAIAEQAVSQRPDLRVLFMSGYAEDVIQRGREGRDRLVDADLLTKPFTRAQLAQKVKSVMGLEQR